MEWIVFEGGWAGVGEQLLCPDGQLPVGLVVRKGQEEGGRGRAEGEAAEGEGGGTEAEAGARGRMGGRLRRRGRRSGSWGFEAEAQEADGCLKWAIGQNELQGASKEVSMLGQGSKLGFKSRIRDKGGRGEVERWERTGWGTGGRIRGWEGGVDWVETGGWEQLYPDGQLPINLGVRTEEEKDGGGRSDPGLGEVERWGRTG